MIRWLGTGKANLKARIADEVELDVAALPYNPRVLDWVRQAQRAGRRVVLATASNVRYAQAVADHLALFDAVIASDESRNLSGRAKLAAIEADSDGPFEYIGNEVKDLAIWSQASAAVSPEL